MDSINKSITRIKKYYYKKEDEVWRYYKRRINKQKRIGTEKAKARVSILKEERDKEISYLERDKARKLKPLIYQKEDIDNKWAKLEKSARRVKRLAY